MKPSDETIEEFRKNYFEEFGEEISKEEAYKKFLRVVNILRVILYPDSEKGRNPESDTPLFPTVDQNPKNM
ncbi:MAG: hypothetical protein WC297_00690 [Candidatus Paceibacterota bacterium]|jgi:hypothetical protein